MEYRIDGKKVRIFPHYLEEINRGKEGIVYKYDSGCLKLYHNTPKKDTLSLRDCEYLKTLDTERIILPQNTVCNKKHILKGYTTSPYIDVRRSIYDISGEEFLREVKLVCEELIYLGEHFVSVEDFWLDNFICSDKFYFLDPGSYVVHWDMMYMQDEPSFIALANFNLECFNVFLYVHIISKYMRTIVPNETVYNALFNEIHQRYLLSSCYNKMNYVEQFIIPELPLEESIKELVKYHKL